MQRGLFGVLIWLMLVVLHAAPSVASSQVMNLDGAWFSCEFAHSQIAPEDGCLMLDDDGFLIAGDTIKQIKVSSSRETECRQNRYGNCFRRDLSGITVKPDSTGTFLPTEEGFKITYWGCAQDYKMDPQDGFFKVTPVGDLCYWTSDKSYFLARYNGVLEFAPDEPDISVFTSDR